MATAPQSRKLNLTRDQLAQFLTDQQQIRQFEMLFATVDAIQVIVGTDFEYQADSAAANANNALAQISALAQDTAVDDAVLNAKVQQALDAIPGLAQALELLALAPRQELGTIASQNSDNVNITGGLVSGLDAPLPVASGGIGVTTAAANLVFAGPTAGAASAPAFRSLVVADIPALTSGASILYGNGSGGFSNVTIGSGVSFAGGTLSATGTGGTVTSVTGTSPVVSSGGTTPAISLASGYGDTQNPYASKTANYFLAAPNGSAGAPTFRAIAAADVPTLNQNTTGTASNVTGTVAIANGGTGATTDSGARTNLGATTVGSNLFTLANPSAITFLRVNADNTVSALDAPTFRTAIGAGTGNGTVTSVAALTLGTTGTDLSSTVANGTTTPVITLNVPTASATNRGALSSTDWSTFNGKQAALVSGTNIKTVNGTTLLGSGDLGTITVPYGGTGRTSFTSNYVPYGNGTGALNVSADLQFDGTNLGVGEAPVSGYRAAIDGDIWVGNTGGTVIGTILNDGGWFGFAASVNVNGTKIKASAEVKTTIGSTDVTRTQGTAFFPGSNNTTQLGIAGLRWSEVFAVNGTINTSDERLKEQAADLTEQEKRVAIRLKGLIKTFKFKDSVLKKGDAARKHIGIMAQSVKDAFSAEGLNAEEYGIFCYDEWDAEYEDVFAPITIMKNDEEVTVLVKTGEKKLIREAGNMYGIRYEQLLAFVIAAI